jgi:hypothetical protein
LHFEPRIYRQSHWQLESPLKDISFPGHSASELYKTRCTFAHLKGCAPMLTLIICSLFAIALFVIGILMMRGKAGFLLAGYNTLPAEAKKVVNEKRLLSYYGKVIMVFGVLTIGIGLGYYFDQRPIAYLLVGIMSLLLIVSIIYGNSSQKFQNKKEI